MAGGGVTRDVEAGESTRATAGGGRPGESQLSPQSSVLSPAHVPLGLLAAGGFIVTASARAMDPLLPVIADEFAVSVGRAALIVTAYALPYGLCQLLYGPLGDRLGKVRVMLGALAAFAVATAACAFAPGLTALALLRLLAGGTAAAMIPLSFAYIGDHFPYEERQAALGRFLAGTALGQVLGTSLGGVFSEYLSWRAIFLVYGVGGVVAWAALRRAARATPEEVAPRAAGDAGLLSLGAYWRLLREPAARVVIGAVFVEGVFLFGGLAYLGAALRERHGISYALIGALLAGFGVGGLAYSRLVGRLVRRLGERRLILVGGGLSAACYLALVPRGWWQLFGPLALVFGLAFNLLHGTLQTKATELSPTARATAVSLFAFSLFLGQGAGAALLGTIVDSGGYGATFAVAGLATWTLALWLAWAVRRQARR